MKKEEEIDSFELLEKIFNLCNEVCFPVGDYSLSTNERLNPTIKGSVSFLLKTIRSFDKEIDKENFAILWEEFPNNLYKGFKYFSISKIEDITIKAIFEIEERIRENPNDDSLKLKKGNGFFIFFEKEFESFSKEMKIKKGQWSQKIKGLKNEENQKSFNSGLTLGSGDYSGYIEF